MDEQQNEFMKMAVPAAQICENIGSSLALQDLPGIDVYQAQIRLGLSETEAAQLCRLLCEHRSRPSR